MPEILPLSAFLSILVVALTVVDCHLASKSSRGSESSNPGRDRLSDLALFTPFLALFYTESFWVSLACTLPIIFSSLVAQWGCYRRGWLESPPELHILAPGSYLLAVVGYFAFFHDGPLAGAGPSPEAMPEGAPEAASYWSIFWPYAAYLACLLFTVTRKSTDGICLSTLVMVLAVTILPFFTGHYWWAMVAGFCILAVTVRRAFRVLEPGSGGALSFVSGYFYLIAAFGSVLVYTILF